MSLSSLPDRLGLIGGLFEWEAIGERLVFEFPGHRAGADRICCTARMQDEQFGGDVVRLAVGGAARAPIGLGTLACAGGALSGAPPV